MRRVPLGERAGEPAFFDMASRYPPAALDWPYGDGFRAGDRAAAHVYLRHWRIAQPHRRLVVLADEHLPGAAEGRALSPEWLFAGIADEIWYADYQGEELPRPAGEALYTQPLWHYWWKLSRSGLKPPVDIRVPEPARQETAGLLARRGVTGPYVTVQPLYDAAYNQHRNAPLQWWLTLTRRLAHSFTVVLLGPQELAGVFPAPRAAVPLWCYGLNLLESLAAIQGAALHVGGETGTTLWAPLLGVPTAALYAPDDRSSVEQVPHWTAKPLPLRAPVEMLGLDWSPHVVANRIEARRA